MGSLQLQTTTTDEFNKALAEHVRMHRHIHDTYSLLHSGRNDIENTLTPCLFTTVVMGGLMFKST